MALTAQAQSLDESVNDTDGGTYTVPYKVVDDTGATLSLLDGRAKAIEVGTAEVGIAPMSAPPRRASKSEVVVDLTFDLVQYYDYLDFREQEPAGTYSPKILDEKSARVFPPQPFELEEALEQIQKQPADAPDSLLLDQRIVDIGANRPIAQRQRAPIYPPQENFSRRLSVPASLLTDSLFYDLGDGAHKLNSNSVAVGSTIFSAGTLMIVSASLEVGGEGFGTLRMGFAVGKPYDKTWTRVAANGSTSEETMTGIKPFSRLTFSKKTTEPLLEQPGTVEYYGLWEHRVFPESDLRSLLPGTQPDDD